MKQRDLMQFAPTVADEGGAKTEAPVTHDERLQTPTWSEAKWDREGELAFAE